MNNHDRGVQWSGVSDSCVIHGEMQIMQESADKNSVQRIRPLYCGSKATN